MSGRKGFRTYTILVSLLGKERLAEQKIWVVGLYNGEVRITV